MFLRVVSRLSGKITAGSRVIRKWFYALIRESSPGCISICLAVCGALFPFIIGAHYVRLGTHTLTSIDQRRGEHAHEQLMAAVHDLERARRWIPHDSALERSLAQAYSLLDQPQSVIALLEQAYRRQPDSLLLREQLARAYDADGQVEHADEIWRALGAPPAFIVGEGDTALAQERYNEAHRWYQRALRFDPLLQNELAFRAAIAAFYAGASEGGALLQLAQEQDQTLEIYALEEALTIAGGDLRWLIHFPQWNVTYGMPLGYRGMEGTFWWDGQALALFSVETSGNYILSACVQHTLPPPVEMALGINGTQLTHVSLERGDMSWETMNVPVALVPGLHTVNVWFLNNALVREQDRNAVIQWVTVGQEMQIGCSDK